MIIKRAKKICKGCELPQYIFSNGLCKVCKAKQTKKKVYKRKPTGELKLFKEIALERDPICTNCKEYIREWSVSNFAHIHSKGSHPELRLNKDNIMILCRDCHYLFDHGSKQQYNARYKDW